MIRTDMHKGYAVLMIASVVVRCCGSMQDFFDLTMPTALNDNSLTACLMVERGDTSLFYNFDRPAAAAVQLAVDYANDVILPSNMTLETIITDIGSACSTRNHAVAYAMDLKARGIACNVYIGPGCGYSAEDLYDMASSLDTLIIGCPAAGIGTRATLNNYQFLARMSITHTDTARILFRFMDEQNYTNPVIIQDQSNSFYAEMGIVVASLVTSITGDIARGAKFIEVKAHQLTNSQIEKYLSSTMVTTRVYVLLAPSDTVRKFMLIAHKLKLTNGDYLFYGVNLFPSASTFGNFSWSYGDENDARAKEAYRPLVVAALNNKQSTNMDRFVETVKKMAANIPSLYKFQDTNKIDVITTHFYEAIIFYASMVRDLAVAGGNFTSGLGLWGQYTVNYSWISPLSGRQQCDSNGDKLSTYVLQSFDLKTGQFQDYVKYDSDGSIKVVGVLNWPNGNEFPPMAPFCGYFGNDPKCARKLSDGEIATAAVFPLLLIIGGTFGGIALFRRLVSALSDPFWWRIFEHTITIATDGQRARSGISGVTTKSKSKPSVKGEDPETMSMSKKQVGFAGETGDIIPGFYDGNHVELRKLSKPYQRVNKVIGTILLPIRRLIHENIQRFVGIAVNEENLCEYVVGECCTKGTLTRLLLHDTLNLDWIFKCALIKDSAAGIAYLHSTSLSSLGNLSSDNCLIHSSFVLKICDYGLHYFRSDEELAPLTEYNDNRNYDSLFWRAPEFLRQQRYPALYFVRQVGREHYFDLLGDAYSYAIILQEMLLRAPPFANRDGKYGSLTAKEILTEVKKGTTPPLRPRIPVSSCQPEFLDLVEQCWDEQPINRPTFKRIRETIIKILGSSGNSIVDHLIKSMEQNAAQLEFQAEERTKQFMEEKRRSDNYIAQMLPTSVAAKLTKGENVLPEIFKSITVHFSDIDGFSELIAEARTPVDTVSVLNTLYTVCDEVIDRYEVYKVETVKDAYLIVSGLPTRNGIRHADHITSMALRLRSEISVMKAPFVSQTRLRLRVGIHSGSCVAAIIGTRMPRYCLFGDTVNTSSRMESQGQPGKIQCSHATKELLDEIGGYFVMERGEIEIKGKGAMKTYWVVGKET